MQETGQEPGHELVQELGQEPGWERDGGGLEAAGPRCSGLLLLVLYPGTRVASSLAGYWCTMPGQFVHAGESGSIVLIFSDTFPD